VFLAVDVHYDDRSNRASAAGVVFVEWTSSEPEEELTRIHDSPAPYEPGLFYRRELPCLMPLIATARAAHPIRTIVIDGYVDLGPDPSGPVPARPDDRTSLVFGSLRAPLAKPGLGRHLHDALGPEVSIVGVAKTRFAGAPAVEVLRGRSERPLFITAAGIDPSAAAAGVSSMHGDHRLPALLARVDRLARSGLSPG
jgi:deoxyribonuclease V